MTTLIKQYGVTGDPTPDPTAGGTNGETDRPPNSDNFYDHVQTAATAAVQGHATAAQITKLDGIEAAADVTDATNVAAAGAIMATTMNADTVLTATSDDTPVATAMAEQTVLGRLTGGHPDDIVIGIADDNIVQIDHASVADNDYAKFTAAGLEGRSYSEVLSDIGAAPANPLATDTLWDAEGDLAVGSGANTATIRNIAVQQLAGRLTGGLVKGISVTELFYNLIFGLATTAHGNTGATETFDLTTTWRHTATVSEACAITVTPPGIDCVCRITLTAASALAITFDAGSHLDHAENWVNGDLPATVPIGRTRICIEYIGGEVMASYGAAGAYT